MPAADGTMEAPEEVDDIGAQDPELLRQLDDAKTTGAPVSAVVQLKRRRGCAPDITAIEGDARNALKRATEATGDEPDDVHVMGRVAVAYVTGSERFVRSLVEQPEIDGAMANDRQER